MRTKEEIQERVRVLIAETANIKATEDLSIWMSIFINKLSTEIYSLVIDEIEHRRRF